MSLEMGVTLHFGKPKIPCSEKRSKPIVTISPGSGMLSPSVVLSIFTVDIRIFAETKSIFTVSANILLILLILSVLAIDRYRQAAFHSLRITSGASSLTNISKEDLPKPTSFEPILVYSTSGFVTVMYGEEEDRVATTYGAFCTLVFFMPILSDVRAPILAFPLKLTISAIEKSPTRSIAILKLFSYGIKLRAVTVIVIVPVILGE